MVVWWCSEHLHCPSSFNSGSTGEAALTHFFREETSQAYSLASVRKVAVC